MIILAASGRGSTTNNKVVDGNTTFAYVIYVGPVLLEKAERAAVERKHGSSYIYATRTLNSSNPRICATRSYENIGSVILSRSLFITNRAVTCPVVRCRIWANPSCASPLCQTPEPAYALEPRRPSSPNHDSLACHYRPSRPPFLKTLMAWVSELREVWSDAACGRLNGTAGCRHCPSDGAQRCCAPGIRIRRPS